MRNQVTRPRPDQDETTSRWQRVKSLLEGAAAFVAIIVASISLAFSLVPTLKPDEPPEKLGGSIVKTEIEQGVQRSDYEENVLHSTDSDAPGTDVDGILIRARVELSGFKTRHYALRAELLDVRTQRPHQYAVEDGTTIGVTGQDLRPSASTDAVTFQIWTRNPSHSGRYFMRLKLFDVGTGSKDGTGDPGPLLDYWTTDPFDYVRAPAGTTNSGARDMKFAGEGAYTVNGELPLGKYLLGPTGGGDGPCLWARLGIGSDPDLAFLGETAIARGAAESAKRIVLQKRDRYLVMEGCKTLRYLGGGRG